MTNEMTPERLANIRSLANSGFLTVDPKDIHEMADTIERLQAEVEKLTVAHDEWREACIGHGDKACAVEKRADKANADLEASNTRVKELEAALGQSQKALAMLIDEPVIRSTSVAAAFAACVEAECKARTALAGGKS